MHFENFADELESVINKTNFSGVVSIFHNDNIIFECAAGFADRTHKVLNTLETRFGIASGTKFFTALSIGKLIDSGCLTLSTRLNQIIKLPFKHYSPEITIQHLLTHTSGIPDYFDEELIDDFDNFKVGIPWCELFGPQDYLQVFPDEDMKFSPGKRFSYSNSGYILLGVIIEKVTGMPFRDFVTKHIFEPIWMKHSGFFAFNKLPENTAYGYIEDKQGWHTNIYNLPIIGASDGGAYTTVGDLRKMWKSFWSGEVVSANLVRAFAQPYCIAESEGENRYYGFGIWIYKNSNVIEEYITGCDAGVSFESGVIRDKNIQLTVISNTTSGAWPLLRAIDPFIGKSS